MREGINVKNETKMFVESIQGMKWYEKIEVLRRFRRMKQKDMVEKCSTHKKNYNAWEKGKVYPKEFNRVLIARALDVRVNDIFNGQLTNNEELITNN